jgi:hypothetical protein
MMPRLFWKAGRRWCSWGIKIWFGSGTILLRTSLS